jgi:hypothetical protein
MRAFRKEVKFKMSILWQQIDSVIDFGRSV